MAASIKFWGRPSRKHRCCVFTATDRSRCDIGLQPWLRTFTAVSRSTQPSILRKTIKWVSAYGLSNNNNGDGACGWQQPIFGEITVQVNWLGRRVGGQPALSLQHSPELSQWLWSWWQHHKHCRGSLLLGLLLLLLPERSILSTVLWSSDVYI